jgi:hypothetical protein
MSDGFTVGLDELAAHEEEVRKIAEEVNTAVEASGDAQAALDNAFGLVGQVFAIPIQGWLIMANNFMEAAAGAGHEVADRIKSAHTMYTDYEAKTTDLVNGIGQGMPS